MKKNCLIKFIFRMLGKGIIYCVKEDKNIYQEFASLPDNLSIRFDILGNGTFLYLNKNGEQLDTTYQDNNQLIITFKNIKSAKLVLFGKISIAESFARHDILLKGDINTALILVRIIDAVEYYLFPRYITKKFLPKMKKQFCRCRLYLFLLFGNKKKKGSKINK